jgi:hypothetical protein
MEGDVPLQIEQAFSWRQRPERVSDPATSRSDIHDDADSLAGLSWRDISADLLARHPACVFGLTGPAFAYYLPGILIATFRSQRTDLLVVDAILGMLDTSADPHLWSELLVEQWGDLQPAEYTAVARWFEWLHDMDPMAFSFDNQYQRIKATLVALGDKSE